MTKLGDPHDRPAHRRQGHRPCPAARARRGGSVQANYGPILGTLTQYFTVIAPDLPGSGGSPKAGGPLDLEKRADDLVDLAVGAGHESFFVCGCSMGCAVAVTAAVRHPDRVRGLVLSTPFGRSTPRPGRRSTGGSRCWTGLVRCCRGSSFR
ncbi:alpha/beta fold hydrolase [Lentzea atacamensis]|uniref:alpha/beta fold hydrolase n=1 Tax=Lentzea atacamensis TaxID=531938 RepID=UPI000DD358A6